MVTLVTSDKALNSTFLRILGAIVSTVPSSRAFPDIGRSYISAATISRKTTLCDFDIAPPDAQADPQGTQERLL